MIAQACTRRQSSAHRYDMSHSPAARSRARLARGVSWIDACVNANQTREVAGERGADVACVALYAAV